MSYILHTFSDFFYIEPVNGATASSINGTPSQQSAANSNGSDILQISRQDHTMKMVARTNLPTNMVNAYSEYIDGIAGVIRLLRGPYLVVMMRSESVAQLPSQLAAYNSGPAPEIRKLTETKLIPFTAKQPRSDGTTPAQHSDERRYMALLMKVFDSQQFYFARNYDITHSLQRITTLPQPHLPIWERADERFFWNRYMSHDLIAAQLGQWVVPLIHGFVASKTVSVMDQSVSVLIIARRNWHRTGRRYTTRGLDHDGHASNYAETEQILYLSNGGHGAGIRVASHVQTRGSVPLLWGQPVTMRYSPKIVIDKDIDAADLAFKRHFAEQHRLYGRQILVNLVNQKGSELKIERGYAGAVERSGDTELKYVGFDFHKQCAKMKYGNLSRLFDIVADELATMNHFRAELKGARNEHKSSADWNVLSWQQGAIRTNCMDCLDRTNVVQSVFARRSLAEQLSALSVFDVWQPGDNRNNLITFPKLLEQALKHIWADHGDALGVAYAGTGAMKSGFTRTGKRDIWGAIDDGDKSLRRYFINNLHDGVYQDALDLFLGVYRPHVSQPSPFQLGRKAPHGAPKPQRNVYRWTLMLFMMIAVLVSYLIYSGATSSTGGIVTLIVLFASLFGVMMKTQGKRFTNQPRFRAFNALQATASHHGGARTKSD